MRRAFQARPAARAGRDEPQAGGGPLHERRRRGLRPGEVRGDVPAGAGQGEAAEFRGHAMGHGGAMGGVLP